MNEDAYSPERFAIFIATWNALLSKLDSELNDNEEVLTDGSLKELMAIASRREQALEESGFYKKLVKETSEMRSIFRRCSAKQRSVIRELFTQRTSLARLVLKCIYRESELLKESGGLIHLHNGIEFAALHDGTTDWRDLMTALETLYEDAVEVGLDASQNFADDLHLFNDRGRGEQESTQEIVNIVLERHR